MKCTENLSGDANNGGGALTNLEEGSNEISHVGDLWHQSGQDWWEEHVKLTQRTLLLRHLRVHDVQCIKNTGDD